MTLSTVKANGGLFLDAEGRQVMLRGVNLGGDCKVPWPNGGTHFPSNFSDHRTVSFVGRPFPLEEADEHLARLARWGFNCLRLLTTWEAVEHAGPGQYDSDYLDYFAAICRKAGEHGLYLFVDFHQDVWSRMSGGDGAPGWTFEAVGLDFTRFHAADAAHIMQAKYDYAAGGRQAAYPQMTWASNYGLPANAIMWSLFWSGSWMTPDFQIDGENVQSFLQGRYLGAMDQIARRIADLPHVLGFDSLNEPSPGWIGKRLSWRPTEADPETGEAPMPGAAFSPLDLLAAAQGLTVTAPVLNGRREIMGEQTLNTANISIWMNGARCPFEEAGIYEIAGGQARALREDAFTLRQGRKADVNVDAYAPFFADVARTTRAHQPDWSLFAEIDAGGAFRGHRLPQDLPERTVNANHWYDVATLRRKTFDPGRWRSMLTGKPAHDAAGVFDGYFEHLQLYADDSAAVAGGAPTLIGEFGIPYDMNDARAYEAWADGERGEAIWDRQVEALGLMYDALDAHLFHSTQWNYTASNRNDLAIGDGWNQEDLSIWSVDQLEQGGNGARAVTGFCRPYVQRAQGRIEAVRFDRVTGEFAASLALDPRIDGATEIYVPDAQYPHGFEIETTGALRIERDAAGQRLWVHADQAGPASITLLRKS